MAYKINDGCVGCGACAGACQLALYQKLTEYSL